MLQNLQAQGAPASAERSGPTRSTIKDGYYFGFAASGYGIMWNERYCEGQRLPEPKEWQDLAKAVYFDHVSIAAPSRSGTTHLTIETILQGEGWDKGWATIKAMAGNFRNVTERSFGVPEAVNSGQVGYRHRHRLLRLLGAGRGFSGEIRLSHRDDHRSGQCRHRRQCAEQGRRRRLSSNSCCRRPDSKFCSTRHPPPAGQPEQSTPRRRRTIPNPFKDAAARRKVNVRRRLNRRRATASSTRCSTSSSRSSSRR